ncbi:MAG: hypothetical protein ABUS47_13385 [Steroidobacter sp.]
MLMHGDWHTKDDEEDDAPDVELEDAPDELADRDDDADEAIEDLEAEAADDWVDETEELAEDNEELAPLPVASEFDFTCLSLVLQAASIKQATQNTMNSRMFISIIHPRLRLWQTAYVAAIPEYDNLSGVEDGWNHWLHCAIPTDEGSRRKPSAFLPFTTPFTKPGSHRDTFRKNAADDRRNRLTINP